MVSITKVGVANGKRKAFNHFLQARTTPIARKGNDLERYTMLSKADATLMTQTQQCIGKCLTSIEHHIVAHRSFHFFSSLLVFV